MQTIANKRLVSEKFKKIELRLVRMLDILILRENIFGLVLLVIFLNAPL